VNTTLRIAEIFHSLQGEGQFVGIPTVFVRTTGCNLRCWFCDTEYTSWNPQGAPQTIDEIVETVESFDCEHVDITGGEPLLQSNVVELSDTLKQRGHFITVETAGTLFRPVVADLIALSPKLANSTPDDQSWSKKHDSLRDRPDVIMQFVQKYHYQLKFVIDEPADLDEVAQYLRRFPEIPPQRVLIMPQATTAEQLTAKNEWLESAASRLGYQVSPRLHVALYGNERGR